MERMVMLSRGYWLLMALVILGKVGLGLADFGVSGFLFL
jgi:hypothetical protein